jgi:hypothetical protein
MVNEWRAKSVFSLYSDSPQTIISHVRHIWRMTKRKRILPPESWFLPAEDRNARRRAQRRLSQQRHATQNLEVNASAADD